MVLPSRAANLLWYRHLASQDKFVSLWDERVLEKTAGYKQIWIRGVGCTENTCVVTVTVLAYHGPTNSKRMRNEYMATWILTAGLSCFLNENMAPESQTSSFCCYYCHFRQFGSFF